MVPFYLLKRRSRAANEVEIADCVLALKPDSYRGSYDVGKEFRVPDYFANRLTGTEGTEEDVAAKLKAVMKMHRSCMEAASVCLSALDGHAVKPAILTAKGQ